VILGAREWKNGVACDLVEGILSGVFLLWMGTEGAGGGIYRRVGVARVRGGGDGAGATRQQTRHGEGGLVLLAMMAAAGALQRGHMAVVVRSKRGGGTRAGGHG
jgi:hypothetical protein